MAESDENSRHELTRRRAIKVGAATLGGAAAWVGPSISTMGFAPAYAAGGSAGGPCKVMVVGDSIAANDQFSFVPELSTNIGGCSFELVGNPNTAVGHPMCAFDGAVAWGTNSVSGALWTYFLGNGAPQGRPEVFLVLIGINDLRLGDTAAEASSDMHTLLSYLGSLAPGARVVLSHLIPHGTDTALNLEISDFNSMLGGIAAPPGIAGITYVATGAYPGGWFDGLHPDDAGTTYLASEFSIGLQAAVGCPTP